MADKFNGTPLDYGRCDRKAARNGYRDQLDRVRWICTHARAGGRRHAQRKSRPLFMIDIAVPRDLDPAMLRLQNVFLYDIDDLEGIVESNLEQRRTGSSEDRSDDRTRRWKLFRQWYKTLGVAPLIRALQEKAADIHAETMESLTKKLPDLSERELKMIRKLTKSIVNQMMHDPIMRIKEMAGEKHADEAMDMFVKMFALEDLEKSQQEERKPAVAWKQSRQTLSSVLAKR